MKSSLFVLTLMVSFYLYREQSEIPRAAGVLAPEEPTQGAAYPSTIGEINSYRIAPLARFDIRARVIRSERYHFGRQADLSPVDLVLGWGAKSNSAVLQ